jgi:hypothetical protein
LSSDGKGRQANRYAADVCIVSARSNRARGREGFFRGEVADYLDLSCRYVYCIGTLVHFGKREIFHLPFIRKQHPFCTIQVQESNVHHMVVEVAPEGQIDALLQTSTQEINTGLGLGPFPEGYGCLNLRSQIHIHPMD